MKTCRRISTVFAAALTLASIGIFGAATPASAGPLCQMIEEQCLSACPDPSDCNKPGPVCTGMIRKCVSACVTQYKTCQRKHPG